MPRLPLVSRLLLLALVVAPAAVTCTIALPRDAHAAAEALRHDAWFAGIVRRDRDTALADSAALRDSSIALPLSPDSLEEEAPELDRSQPGYEFHRRGSYRRRFDRELWMISDYNRVDQLRVGMGVSPLPAEAFYPRAEVNASYVLGRTEWSYYIALEQPLDQHPYLALGGRVYRRTDSEDWSLVSRAENMLSGLLVRQDYRDYFQRRGVTPYARLEWGEAAGLELDLHLDELSSLHAIPETWSLFGGGRAFRPNPAIPEGTLRQVEGALQLSTRRGQRAPRPGLDAVLGVDAAGGALGGDFRFSRARAEGRWTFKLAPGLWLNQRFAAGTSLGGEVPPEFRFYAGGVGTLRGYEYKQFTGEHYYLYNLEYAANLGQHISHFDRNETLRGLELVFFAEMGKAWGGATGFAADSPAGSPGSNATARPAWDAGAGIQTSGDGFHLYLAQNLQSPRTGPKLTFRLSRTF